MTRQIPSLAQAKDQAKQMRAKLLAEGTEVSHANALERVAHQNGFRDWNTFSAAIAQAQAPGWSPGDRVTGTYLGQPFSARILSVEPLKPGWTALELQFDEAVDVVTSEAFSNFRSRLRSVIGPKGHSAERTSDGTPHLKIEI